MRSHEGSLFRFQISGFLLNPEPSDAARHSRNRYTPLSSTVRKPSRSYSRNAGFKRSMGIRAPACGGGWSERLRSFTAGTGRRGPDLYTPDDHPTNRRRQLTVTASAGAATRSADGLPCLEFEGRDRRVVTRPCASPASPNGRSSRQILEGRRPRVSRRRG